ncbi:helix-turn-helix domain-containing protein [Trujillonella endophytica]|uniref:Regulatory protein, luxR family n=1 Tax=Trujillonella endophytica TaxID=673521 RepID=A0A1H8T0W3_9ACTN|nr:helix-turn-helix transcriptional regulator [Trujillella endophytica]SEO84552.1 regulatory protein, luxR family [Trujillella endophytica]
MAGAAAADPFAERTWAVAYRLLSRVPLADLSPADLERRAVAAYLLGEDGEAAATWEHAYNRHADVGEPADAARCAFWAAFCSMMRGQMAHAGGWLSRGRSVLGPDLDCPARGYLLIPGVLAALDADDAAGARGLAVQAGDIASRFQDADLAALSTLGHGQALVASGDEAGGLARLDEVMLAVCSGEVGPIVSGIAYCAVILECLQLFDLARAAEWTAALDGWCRAQPDLVPYRGQCLVHQSQLRQAAGDWAGALATVAEARDRLSDPPHPALGLARYQEGELCRVRGDLPAAAAAYRRAGRAGYEPMPGLALLELVRGDAPSAAAGIGRALREARQPFRRPGLLAAAVEIRVAVDDVTGATEAAAELTSIADQTSSPVLKAMAGQATGAALLASGRTTDAMVHLREARTTWQRLGMPYDAARSAVLMGLGCAASGDSASAALEFGTARAIFTSLGAGPDLRRVCRLAGGQVGRGPLSEREREVLVLVAGGSTSRQIASRLGISQHTVRRHLENTFAKLGVRSRAAAVAYAYEHDLL